MRFADSTTSQASPTHQRAWKIKRSKPIPEITTKNPTPLTLISYLRSENSERNRKEVKFSFIERAILQNGQLSESVISFNEPNKYWKPGAPDDEPFLDNDLPNNKIKLQIIIYRFLISFLKVNGIVSSESPFLILKAR